MLILGLNLGENASAAFVVNGRLAFAAEEERYVGVKHVRGVPYAAIRAGLTHLGLRLRDVHRLTISWDPGQGIPRRLLASLRTLEPGSLEGMARRGRGYLSLLAEALTIRTRLRAAWPDEPLRFRVRFVPHHLAHAAAAHYWSGEEVSSVLTVDGMGEEDCTVLWKVRGHEFTVLERRCYPHSLGHFYSVMAAYLGFEIGDGEGKMMGLASYGVPRYLEPLRAWTTRSDGAFRLDARRLNYAAAHARVFHPDLIDALGPPVGVPTETDARHCDLAASTQATLELHLRALVRRLAAAAPAETLCLGGGVALNCVSNGRLYELGLFRRIHVGPAPTDAGTSVGAALVEAARVGFIPSIPQSVFLGDADPSRLPDEIPGLASAEVEEPELAVAELLARGLVVGWFHDRMELGPRALGNRSILAPAAPASMKDVVNLRVKMRENFRPFAPAVKAECASEYFAVAGPSPFMSHAFPARERGRALMPATVHRDGTGRLQTVDRENFPSFHRMLDLYCARTGAPGVMNTSLNIRGKPIAATKQDALRLLRETELDALVADGQLFVKGQAVPAACLTPHHAACSTGRPSS